MCRCFSLRRQSFSLVLNKLRCCGLLFEVASSVASSSCIRVVFPRRGREALFLVCSMSVDSVPFMKAHSCRPLVRLSFSVACVYRHKNWKRQTVLFPVHVAVSSPCRVAALQLRVPCFKLFVLMLALAWMLTSVSWSLARVLHCHRPACCGHLARAFRVEGRLRMPAGPGGRGPGARGWLGLCLPAGGALGCLAGPAGRQSTPLGALSSAWVEASPRAR